ncbi:MAG: NAD(P)/FAD-dependent oxidoreductase [Bacteroidetes bacterium]|nr:MAG: NAD(P)/FAD-dependent oxidoreductase [Bacteroidota bacterium]
MKPKIAVIGAGPAGVACSVQLARFGYKPVLFEKDEIGGLMRNANCINNYPGFPDGISGLNFSKLLHRHLINYDIRIIKKEIHSISFVNNLFCIQLKKIVLNFNYLIISTGTKPIKPDGFSREKMELFSYDIVKHLNEKNKTFVIVGAGDAAFDYALTLSTTNEVTILNRSKKINSINELKKKVINNKKIKYLDNTSIIDITGDESSIIINAIKNGREKLEIICNNLIYAIGREPNLDFLDKSIKSKMDKLKQSRRLFIIGDASGDKFRQISISSGSAIKSAMELHSYLLNSQAE